MPIQRFGFNEKPISNQEWINIGKSMKTSPYVKLRNLKFIAQAQHQYKRFENIAILSGSVMFLLLLKFPVIRIQPAFRRITLSGGLAYPCYWYIVSFAERFKVKAIKHAYRKNNLRHKAHPKISI